MVVAEIQAFYTLLRLSGTLQKHVFGPLVTDELKDVMRKARPDADANMRRLIDMGLWSWDTAESWAYDDPVELLADLGAMGVKLSLLRAGVALPPRLGLTLGAKAAVTSVETFMRGIMGLLGGDPVTAAANINEGLDGFIGKLIPDFVTDELIKDGTQVAVDIATFAGEAGEFVSKASSGNVIGSLLSGIDLAKKGFAVVTSFLGFVNQVQKELPEPPPGGRTITDHELRRFEEARREKPISGPKPPPPITAEQIARAASSAQGEAELRALKQVLLEVRRIRLEEPEVLRTSLLRFGGVIPAGGSLRALKDRREATTFPFG